MGIDLQSIIGVETRMGNEQRRALESSYRVLIMHLLKWQAQPGRRSSSWDRTIRRERINIHRREAHSQALKNHVTLHLGAIYKDAVKEAALETGLPRSTFPALCPYTLEQLRSDAFLPD